jgi:glycosyltransferase involved in cell wall biosynthesis
MLLSASLLFTPSAFFRDLFIENEFDPRRVQINKNGVVAPKRAMKRSPPSGRPMRFGFVGGDGPIKGAAQVRKAFRSLAHDNYELHVVDNELNLGHRSIDPALWEIPGKLEIIPAYTQNVIDDFFESIDVLLFPTQWKESFGLAIREALIRDVWVIATDAGGVIEDIVNGENGDVIALEDDGTELAAAIGKLLDNPSRLDGYVNPHAQRIQLFDQQADELYEWFTLTRKEAQLSIKATA